MYGNLKEINFSMFFFSEKYWPEAIDDEFKIHGG